MTYQQMLYEEYKRRSKVAKKHKRRIGRFFIAVPAKVTMAWIKQQAGYTIRTKRAVRFYKAADTVFSKRHSRKKSRQQMARAARKKNRTA